MSASPNRFRAMTYGYKLIRRIHNHVRDFGFIARDYNYHRHYIWVKLICEVCKHRIEFEWRVNPDNNPINRYEWDQKSINNTLTSFKKSPVKKAVVQHHDIHGFDTPGIYYYILNTDDPKYRAQLQAELRRRE